MIFQPAIQTQLSIQEYLSVFQTQPSLTSMSAACSGRFRRQAFRWHSKKPRPTTNNLMSMSTQGSKQKKMTLKKNLLRERPSRLQSVGLSAALTVLSQQMFPHQALISLSLASTFRSGKNTTTFQPECSLARSQLAHPSQSHRQFSLKSSAQFQAVQPRFPQQTSAELSAQTVAFCLCKTLI